VTIQGVSIVISRCVYWQHYFVTNDRDILYILLTIYKYLQEIKTEKSKTLGIGDNTIG